MGGKIMKTIMKRMHSSWQGAEQAIFGLTAGHFSSFKLESPARACLNASYSMNWRFHLPLTRKSGRVANAARSVAYAGLWVAFMVEGRSVQAAPAPAPGAAQFRGQVQPILKQFCYDCHADGENKGGVSFDEFKSDDALLDDRELWGRVLKNLRAGIMPPEKKPHPGDPERERIAQWIKSAVFRIDPQNPDPGRVTVRRLNRAKYHNTIHDLLGVEFNTDVEFPPDDTGHGFDNIGDVLTLSPMLLEKYLAAARTVVAEAVPVTARVPAETVLAGTRFLKVETNGVSAVATTNVPDGMLSLPYYEPAHRAASFTAPRAGIYRLVLDLTSKGNNAENGFDSNRCQIVFKADGQELLRREYGWNERKELHFELDAKWPAGERRLSFELQPTNPGARKTAALELRIQSVTVRGPLDEKSWVHPKNYDRFFAHEPPKGAAARRKFAREVLDKFARRAYRRPVDAVTLDRLVALAESIYRQPGKSFEAGAAHAMVAVLASPQFLFREEGVTAAAPGQAYPFVDEYALASRLSYFLWSSMPDDELFRLAAAGKLRENLAAQTRRMLADPRAEALAVNFCGQWLEARDIATVQIDARSVLNRDSGASAGGGGGFFGRPRVVLDGELRKAMERETETYFSFVARENRSVLELVDSDYAFLNEKLARHYGLTNLDITGPELRRVTLPANSPRGGVLTQGTILAVTSNPTRTSPVKRGLFVLENFLGTPPAPPPPDIPPLEQSDKGAKDRELTLREVLEIHRSKPLCSSCHSRMDPLGLAFENFNALGMWREQERGQPLDATGKLITGEPFQDIRDLKRIIATRHHLDFYRTLTERLLTYALGRGLEYYDTETVDQIVGRLEKENGRFSALLLGIVESAPFQKCRPPAASDGPETAKPSNLRAELKPSL